MSGGVALVKRSPDEVAPAPEGKVRIFIDESGRLALVNDAGTVTTPEALISSLLTSKQDAATAATDVELASAVATINAALASEQTAREAAKAVADAAVPKAGGTMTGPLTLSGDPTNALHPVTKQFLTAQINALINGAPGALDTLKEIAERLEADESVATALAGTVAGKLTASSNLSDLGSASTARANLGLHTAATKDAGAAGEAGKVLNSDDTTLLALVTAGVAEVGTAAPSSTLALGRWYIRTNESGTPIALYLGRNPSGPKEIDLTGTPADGSVTPSKFAGAYIDGAVGTPSIRTLLTTLEEDATHAATASAVKSYVDALVQSRPVKPSAAFATTEPLPACTYANGTAGVGATLTGNANGALKLDGENGLTVGQRILVKDQAAEAQNGLYVVTQNGGVSQPFILTRDTSMDSASEFQGAAVFVENGTVNKAQGFVFASSASGFTVGTTAVKWTKFTGVVPDGSVTAGKVGSLNLGSRFSADGWGSGSGSFVPGAKAEIWVPIKIQHACTITGLTYQVGATANGKVIAALHNAAGERKAVSAEVAQGTVEQPQKVPFEAALVVTEPGLYWACIVFESATGTCMGAFNLNPIKKETQAEFKAAAALVAPTDPVGGVKSPYLLTY